MEDNIKKIITSAQKFMSSKKIDGWLLYDYHGMNPIFWETVGQIPNVTRPCWLWIPKEGIPELIVSYVDQNRFEHLVFHGGSPPPGPPSKIARARIWLEKKIEWAGPPLK